MTRKHFVMIAETIAMLRDYTDDTNERRTVDIVSNELGVRFEREFTHFDRDKFADVCKIGAK